MCCCLQFANQRHDILMPSAGAAESESNTDFLQDQKWIEKYERDDERSAGAVHDTSSTRAERDEGSERIAIKRAST